MKTIVFTLIFLSILPSFSQEISFKSIHAIQTVANDEVAISAILKQSNTTEVTSITVESSSGNEFDLVVTTHSMDVPCKTSVAVKPAVDIESFSKQALSISKISKAVCEY